MDFLVVFPDSFLTSPTSIFLVSSFFSSELASSLFSVEALLVSVLDSEASSDLSVDLVSLASSVLVVFEDSVVVDFSSSVLVVLASLAVASVFSVFVVDSFLVSAESVALASVFVVSLLVGSSYIKLCLIYLLRLWNILSFCPIGSGCCAKLGA
jgi:hypothetical protein